MLFSLPFPAGGRAALACVAMAIAGLALACGGPGATIDDMPEWMAEKPDAEQRVFGTGTGTSASLQSALEKASVRARGDIASTIEVRFQGLTKDFREETGEEYLQQFTQAQKEVVSQFLRGTQARKQVVREEKGRYRAYVLMEMPIGRASQQLMSKLKQSEELYSRFRASEAFEELQQAIKTYENTKTDTPQ